METMEGKQKLKQYIIEKSDEAEERKGKDEKSKKEGEDLIEIDFGGLQAANKDVIAWIQIPGRLSGGTGKGQ